MLFVGLINKEGITVKKLIGLGLGILAAASITVTSIFASHTDPPQSLPECLVSRQGDNINVNTSRSPRDGKVGVVDIINTIITGTRSGHPNDTTRDGIRLLDRDFEYGRGSCSGYQIRDAPAIVPPSPFPAQRVMWSSLAWLNNLSTSERENMERRILRLRCEYGDAYGVCVYLLLDAGSITIGAPARGFLLTDSLNPECELRFWTIQSPLCAFVQTPHWPQTVAYPDETVTLTVSHFPTAGTTFHVRFEDMGSTPIPLNTRWPQATYRYQRTGTYSIIVEKYNAVTGDRSSPHFLTVVYIRVIAYPYKVIVPLIFRNTAS